MKKSTEEKITFERYFEKILFDEKIGYYANKDRKIGLEGDFITAPSFLTVPFGRAISSFINKILKENKDLKLVEIGGRKGDFLKILLKYTGLSGVLIEKFKVENPEIKSYKSIGDLSDSNYIFFLNEVLDSIPIRRIKYDGKNFFESYILKKENEQIEIWEKIEDDNVKKYYNSYLNFIPDENNEVKFEYPQRYLEFLQNFKRFKSKIYIIFIDYGGYPSEIYPDYISAETIRGYKNQKLIEDIFNTELPFDITYHVNFKFVEDILNGFGFEKILYETQGKFLVDNGILNYVMEDEIEKLKTLILPGGMGEIFKIMVFKSHSQC